MSEKLLWHVRPALRHNTLVLAFEGWNDAGDAATAAVSFLCDAIRAVPLAEIDADEFYDFTVRRPEVSRIGAGREILWPTSEFRFGSIDEHRELVLGLGIEPHMRWRAFCDEVVALCRVLDTRRVVLLGAYLAEVVYSQPVQVQGFASEPGLIEKLGVAPSEYSGPTGIVGVLAERLEAEGFDIVSLWAALPHYIEASPNPRGALALIQKLTQCLDFRVDEAPLRKNAAEFEQEISRIVASNEELADYVRQLKRREFAQ